MAARLNLNSRKVSLFGRSHRSLPYPWSLRVSVPCSEKSGTVLVNRPARLRPPTSLLVGRRSGLKRELSFRFETIESFDRGPIDYRTIRKAFDGVGKIRHVRCSRVQSASAASENHMTLDCRGWTVFFFDARSVELRSALCNRDRVDGHLSRFAMNDRSVPSRRAEGPLYVGAPNA